MASPPRQPATIDQEEGKVTSAAQLEAYDHSKTDTTPGTTNETPGMDLPISTDSRASPMPHLEGNETSGELQQQQQHSGAQDQPNATN